MANFDISFQKIAQAEGGYVNDPDDAGGETYMGISRKHNPNWKGWNHIDNIKKYYGASNVNYNAKKSLALQSLVKELYKTNYWDVFALDDVPSQNVAHQIFDTTVNCGQKAAIKIAQKAMGVPATGIYTNDFFDILKNVKD